MRSVDWRLFPQQRGTSPLFVRVITVVITLTCNYSVITPPIFCCCVIRRLYLRAFHYTRGARPRHAHCCCCCCCCCCAHISWLVAGHTHRGAARCCSAVRSVAGSLLGLSYRQAGGLLVVVHLSKYSRTRTHADEGLRDLAHAARTHTRTRTAHTHAHAHTHARTRTHARTHARTHTHAHARTRHAHHARTRTNDRRRTTRRAVRRRG